MAVYRDPASFRDPSSHVYREGTRVLRALSPSAAPHYEYVRDEGLLARWIERRWVVGTREIDAPAIPGVDARYVLEHDPVRFVSYPYEWSFPALKAAALLHLDLQLDALRHGVHLSDASAYNVQFDGARPMFIDIPSFRRYHPGEYWAGHRQFCEQFLNPLLLRSAVGVPHNAWFRGSLEGITAAELNALLPAARKMSWNIISHVTLPARLAARAAASRRPASAPRRPLPTRAYAGLLNQLRDWIAGLEPLGPAQTTWSHYETTHTYSDDERERKHAVVARFMQRVRPAMVWDVGCNTGEFAQLALESGAEAVVGFEPDHGACERAYARAATLPRPFLPLVIDVANPSPGQGWNEHERSGLAARGPADAILALAVTHHLAIGRNVPLDDVAAWLTAQAPAGVVEFVPKDDPMVRLMLASRADVFDAYTMEAFASALARFARVVASETVSASGRCLFVYERP